MDQATEFLLDIWKHAFLSETPVEIDCKTASKAVQFRMSLYNAAKPYKDGLRAKQRPDVHEAVTNCMISLKQDDAGAARFLVVKNKMMNELMESVSEQLGILLPADKLRVEMEEAARRLQAAQNAVTQAGQGQGNGFGATKSPYHLKDKGEAK